MSVRRRLAWRKQRENFVIEFEKRLVEGAPKVVPDGKYPNMWRLQFEDGQLSDMVNLTRAKDAALGYADRLLDPR
jgi:hypothetical protein